MTDEGILRRSRLPRFARFALLLLCVFLSADVVIVLMIWLPHRREQQIIQAVHGWRGKIRSESMETKWLGEHALSLEWLIGAEPMKVFERVTEAWCSDSAITDSDVLHLTGLRDLKRLGLGRTAVSDAALVHIRGMSELESLYLDKTGISDAGMEHLSRMTTLRKLSLAGTSVSDPGLAHLSRLKNLELLWLNQTQVSEAGYMALRAALPDCKIDR